MKKYCLIVLLFVSSWLSAQDVIIKKTSEKIEAKIEVISSSEIHYKKYSNLNGPTFIISTSEVVSILYENGEVQVFENSKAKEKTAVEVQTHEKMIKLDDDIYKYGELKLSEEEYVNFLKDNCDAAYTQYVGGKAKVRTGVTLLFAGIASDGLGIALTVIGAKNKSTPMLVLGPVFMGLGTAFEIACIPIWIKGGVARKNAIETFNETCAQDNVAKLSLGVQMSNEGIGLALNF